MAFRAAPDLEAQRAQPQDCAWSTVFNHGTVFSRHDPPTFLNLNRGSVLSRHDSPPLPSLLPFSDDPPPGYTYPPPPPPISGSDPSESATNGTVDRHSKLAIVIVLILVVALFATAIYFTFFNPSKV